MSFFRPLNSCCPGGRRGSALEEPRSPERVLYVAVGLCVRLFFALLAGSYLVYQLREVVLALFVADLFSVIASGPVNYLPRRGPPCRRRPAGSTARFAPSPATAREDLFWCLGPLLPTVNDFAKAAGRLLGSRGRCWELACRAAVPVRTPSVPAALAGYRRRRSATEKKGGRDLARAPYRRRWAAHPLPDGGE
jgi:hypothetical protein